MLVFSSAWSSFRTRTSRRPLVRHPSVFAEPLEERKLLAGSGLSGTYYDNMDFTGASITRVDPVVDFNWVQGSPDYHIQPDTFSAKWTGQIQAPTSGTYTLYTFSDDGVRLTVNGQTLIDHLVPQWPTEYSAPITLAAGQKYNIELDFIERYGEAECHLSWSGPGMAKQVVPSSVLYPTANTPAPDTTAPTAPSNLRVTSKGDISASLAWNASTDNVGVTGYEVYKGSTLLATLPANQLAYTATALTQNTAYTFSVKALDAAGNRSAATSVALTTNASTTTGGSGLSGTYYDNMDFTGASITRVDPVVDFNWVQGSPDYHIQPDTFSAKWTGQIQAPTSGTYTLYTFSDDGVRLTVNGQTLIDHLVPQWPTEYSAPITLAAGQKYNIELDFIERYGEAESHLSWSGPGIAKQIVPSSVLYPTAGTTTPDTTAPSAPGNLRVTSKTDISVALAWDAATDNVGVTGYEVYKGSSLLATLPANQLAYTATSLTQNTAYTFSVKALDAAANRSAAASVNVSTNASAPPPDTTVPTVPSNFHVTDYTSNSISLSWTASTDNVGVTGYELYRNNALIQTLAATATSFTDPNLQPSTLYQYQIRAADAAANKSAFASISQTTAGVSTPNPDIPPTNQTGRPYKGVPFSVGQRIEAEDFDLGGEGVAFHDLTPGNANGNVYRNDGPDVEPNIIGGVQNGYDVGWIQAGEWLTYTVNTPNAGYYNLDAAFGVVGPGGTYHVEVDGHVASGQVTVPDTGHWHRMNALRVSSIPLSAGNHVLKIVFDTNGENGTFANFDWMQLSAGSSAPGPDLQIQNHGETAYFGAGTYSTDPNAQTRAQSTSFLPPVYGILIKNNSNVSDSFIIHSSSDNTPGWKYRVYAADDSGAEGPPEISAISGSSGGWTVGPIAPGATFTFRIDIGPSALAAGGSTDSVVLTATSKSDPTRTDTVKAFARVAGIRLPEFQRRNFDDSGVYLLDLSNQGNLPSTYRMSAAPASGSTVKIFDSYWGGNDITAAVLNGSYVSPSLGHDERFQFRVEVSGSGQPSVNLNAVSVEDGSTSDHVIITKAPVKPELSKFVIGVWSQPTYNFNGWKSRGINTIMHYESQGGTVSVAQWSADARSYGLDYIRVPDPNINNDVADPNLLAWMHNDEPDIDRTPISELQNNYNYYKSVDPSMPVLTNYAGSEVVDWNTGVTEQEYLNMLKTNDIGSSSVYPVTGWGRPDDLDIEGRAVERLEKWSQGQPQLAIVESADSELSWLPSDIPGPSPEQVRYEIWDAVVHGAKGVLYFPFAFSPNFTYENTPPDVALEMTHQDARLADLGPALMSPTDPYNFGIKLPNGLEGTWRLYNGKKYFIVFNTQHQTVTGAALTLVNTPGTSAVVEGESRTVAINNGTITDTFAPYEMHAYVVG
jgi:chitodextrinase